MKQDGPTQRLVLVPPAPDVCQVCARDHGIQEPHDRDSLYYRIRFHEEQGRWPSWADALAHCPPEVARVWRDELAAHGVVVDEQGQEEEEDE